MKDTIEELTVHLARYSQLSYEYQALVAPYDAERKKIDIAKEDATAHLTFEMETLETLIKPLVLTMQQTQKVPFVTVVYQRRDKWDREILFNIAKEVPAVMSAYEDASFVQFRPTKG